MLFREVLKPSLCVAQVNVENSVYNALLLVEEEEEEEEGVCLTSPIPPHQTTDDVRGSEVTASGRMHACLLETAS